MKKEADAVVDKLYLSDKEIAARVGVTAHEWTATATVLERYGLPRRDPLFDNRRCWPAVEAFLIDRATPARTRPEGECDGYKGFKSSPRRAAAPKQERASSAVLGGEQDGFKGFKTSPRRGRAPTEPGKSS
jgi:hypothetical protein